MAAQVLVANGLVKRYDGLEAVHSLDLVVVRGAVVGLVGPNGCGKTTTLGIVVGLVPADAGEALVAGARSGSISARAATGFVPDEPSGLDELSVKEFLHLYEALHRMPTGFRRRAATLLDAFGLASRLDTPLGGLSLGLRRQAALVAVFALAPPLVVIDEATAALDPHATIVLRESLRALTRRGSGVLLATQDLAFAETVCDEVVLLDQGRVVASGSPSELRIHYGARSLEDTLLKALGQSTFVEELGAALDAC